MPRRTNEWQLRRLVALQDRERRLLACEIHDGFVQDVVGAQLAIDELLERLLVTDRDAVEPLLRIRAVVRQAIAESRRLVGELRPVATEDRSLVDAIQDLVEQEESRRRLDVRFSADPRVSRLAPLPQASVVRIVQEALNNVARHAQTREVEIELSERRSKLRVVVRDRGIGFDSRRVAPDRYGLAGIRERARIFGGTASIRSKPGEGTVVTVTLPVGEVQDPPQDA